jgi:hypothetical protein
MTQKQLTQQELEAKRDQATKNINEKSQAKTEALNSAIEIANRCKVEKMSFLKGLISSKRVGDFDSGKLNNELEALKDKQKNLEKSGSHHESLKNSYVTGLISGLTSQVKQHEKAEREAMQRRGAQEAGDVIGTGIGGAAAVHKAGREIASTNLMLVPGVRPSEAVSMFETSKSRVNEATKKALDSVKTAADEKQITSIESVHSLRISGIGTYYGFAGKLMDRTEDNLMRKL